MMRATCIMGYATDACASVRKKLDAKFASTNSSLYNIYLPCYYQKVND
jgi:hypothetical protein